MKNEDLNRLLVAIVEKRMEIGRLNYSAQEYDDLEEELHILEDALVNDYGQDIEKALAQIHQQYCPDTEILSPIAYLAQKYIKIGKHQDGTAVYDIANLKQGVIIDSADFDEAHLVILPNPIRVLFTDSVKNIKDEIWILN
jgi:hypothetical protein